MKLAIMQPYLFPYVGYFQLINAVDTFVIYDDVTFIKQGWINRNYILLNGMKHLITLTLEGASSYKQINQVMVGKNKKKILKTVQQAYSKAPHVMDILPLIEENLLYENNNLALYVRNSIQKIANYLNIQTKLLISSDIKKNNELKGPDKVIELCKILGASKYINAIGGRNLYNGYNFRDNFIDLYFLKTDKIIYKQFDNDFISNLSIIDVLMFNSKSTVINYLKKYELVQ